MLLRCFANKPEQKLYAKYHDEEWAMPIHDDCRLFEMLILEGAQAGLSWETVLKKRENYRKIFDNFDVKKVAKFSDEKLEEILLNSGIIRNRLKIFSTRQNAKIFLEIQKEFGSFNRYLWAFVDNKPIKNHWHSLKEIPTKTKESDAISKDLKKRGMNFVGSTIIYAYMQAVGLVDDHITTCWLYKK